MKNDYDIYITNLMIESTDYTSGTWTFTGSLPVPHKCPRKSCRGGLNSSCVIGYHGPLCSLCDVGYYNRMNRFVLLLNTRKFNRKCAAIGNTISCEISIGNTTVREELMKNTARI